MRIFIGLHKPTVHLNHKRIFVGLHKPTIHLNHMRIFVGLHKPTTSPPQSYEDICRTTQVYCLDITHKTLQHHHLNHMRVFIGLHKPTVQLNYMRIFIGLHKPTTLILQDWRMTPDVVISTLPLSEGDILCHTRILSKLFKLHQK